VLQEVAPGFKFADIQQELQPLLVEYYSYIGSQTFPPCYQGVQWMIATQVPLVFCACRHVST
jgi:carbonic anhydrase